jgi:hypothetical protein
MKLIVTTLCALLVGSTPVVAQGSSPPNSPPANSDAPNRAINSSGETNPGAPVAGANSFTEGQARSRIESRGFSNVSGLTEDDSGVWRGTAMKDGRQQTVSVDFQGNVVATTK